MSKPSTAKREKVEDKKTKDEAPLETKAVKAAAAPITGTPIQELQPGQQFELDGDLFKIKTVGPEVITAAKLEWAPSGDCMIERWQRPVLPDTLVIPREG